MVRCRNRACGKMMKSRESLEEERAERDNGARN
jgi:hypothetical protein